ncbi:UdgX family uracil-DNA binding protein [Altererythrobacter indicus]|uniref:Type-4 uracil-DNA glycosylase n=1 Tax=Altericroceibacterium indicum TaxID=374177 RepID=A0A845A5A5_9SPHN|nr:UdgX family uracil-DNA binding protein [Altericroceibacterium indicum]MXP25370.1 UdgX family uracil-DNA binding protein [Altericroceibacterium indicum]
MIGEQLQCVTIRLNDAADFDEWRGHARRLVQADIPPDQVIWECDGQAGDLFGTVSENGLPQRAADKPVRASRAFVAIAKKAILHSDPRRFTVLYSLLWRLQSASGAMEDRADADVRQADEWARQVRRDIHKMRAFLRFREVDGDEPHYVAWFEPDFAILRENAAFFTSRFANMRWSILTPKGSLHWDGEVLHEGPAASRHDAPQGDPTEDLWRTYYASTFNPSRLKVNAMVKEMPRRYWKNMPEAALISDLIAGAQAREAAMVLAGEAQFQERPLSLAEVGKEIACCRRCPIGELPGQAVMGEGPADAPLMIIGEQPGDQEEMQGRPFVGPAGQVLSAHLAKAGIAREQAYLTNAVKHFKFTPRGKRRLHQTPTAKEVDMCRWWVESERALVKPKLILALGSSAARSLLGRTVSLAAIRGRPQMLEDGSELWITTHPSYLLRLDGAAAQEQEALFQADLKAVALRLAEISA